MPGYPSPSGRPASTGSRWRASVGHDDRWPAGVDEADGAKYPVMSAMMLVVTLEVTQMDPSAAVGTITELARTPPRRTLPFELPGSAASRGTPGPSRHRRRRSPSGSAQPRHRRAEQGLHLHSTTSRRTAPATTGRCSACRRGDGGRPARQAGSSGCGRRSGSEHGPPAIVVNGGPLGRRYRPGLAPSVARRPHLIRPS